jgi:hypothetical protein
LATGTVKVNFGGKFSKGLFGGQGVGGSREGTNAHCFRVSDKAKGRQWVSNGGHCLGFDLVRVWTDDE